VAPQTMIRLVALVALAFGDLQ
jgi:hypothetical protein